MFGIIDTRFSTGSNIGVLRGKSMSIQAALKKSRGIFTRLLKYEENKMCPLSLKIVKLVGTIKLGDTVEESQTTGIPVDRKD